MDNENYNKILEEAKEKAKREVDKKYSPDMLGYIHALEKETKRILKEEYGIEYPETNKFINGDCID